MPTMQREGEVNMIYDLFADLHLRPDPPRCRTDKDWKQTMTTLLEYIAKQPNIKVFAGDLLNGTEAPSWLINLFLRIVTNGAIYAGNHDFKHKNLTMIENSRIGHILKNSQYTAYIPKTDDGFVTMKGDPTVIMCHKLIFHPSQAGLAKFGSGTSADDLIDEAVEYNPDVRYVFVGDNHHHFTYTRDGVTVINPGSPLRYSANMKDETCGFYQVDTDKDIVTFVEIPDDADLVTDKYIEAKKEQSRVLQELSAGIGDVDATKTLNFFERCDEGIKELSTPVQNLYEDIKEETIRINYASEV